jgi:hypothetical protein
MPRQIPKYFRGADQAEKLDYFLEATQCLSVARTVFLQILRASSILPVI